jgi:uncharacterized protein (TIGR03118 family)
MKRPAILAGVVVAALATAAVLAAATPAAQQNAYATHNLVSDQDGVADHTDGNLVNAWGLAALTGGPWWVADNEPSVSTLYTPDGTPFPPASPLVVSVPNHPTGLVANNGSGFDLGPFGGTGPARFIFSTEEGNILAWNLAVVPNPAITVASSPSEDASYKGLAIASTASGDRIYATDFHNGAVDVFDGSFGSVQTPGAFTDPELPKGFAPFGIQTIGSTVFVAYAKQDADAEEEVAGQSLGIVDAYDTDGGFLGRVATRGQLNAPWGLALAPASFGRFGGDLLVGNFGDGEINAYAQEPDGTWEHQGELRGSDNRPLAIDGLWALEFGLGGALNGSTDTLFFTAGPDDESHGLFGTIAPSS